MNLKLVLLLISCCSCFGQPGMLPTDVAFLGNRSSSAPVVLPLVIDNFVDTLDVNGTNHVTDATGAQNLQVGWSNLFKEYKIHPSGNLTNTTTGNASGMYLNLAMPTANYQVSIDLTNYTQGGSSEIGGGLRWTTTAANMYYLCYLNDSHEGRIYAGTYGSLGASQQATNSTLAVAAAAVTNVIFACSNTIIWMDVNKVGLGNATLRTTNSLVSTPGKFVFGPVPRGSRDSGGWKVTRITITAL